MAFTRKFYVSIISATLCLLLLSSSAPAKALSGSDFSAGRIIDDAVFFNPNTMNPGDIQSFMNAKVPVCDTNGTQPYAGTTRAAYGTSRGYPPPYTCLKDYSQDTAAKAADAYCGAITGGTKTSAQIIYDVSQACGVSPKVLLVLLQKEQSLVTDDWPWSVQYRSATGYGCPDTADCDSTYYGFYNQVYYAARQYQRYARQANLFNYTAGQNNYIQYNPNAGCGGSNVFIQNQATAGLYNYTPYQPNASALANLYGSGDSCGAYGNRNFWRMYIDWFGSTLSPVPYAWSYESQNAYTDSGRTQSFTSTPTVVPNGTIYLRVKARNMGTQTWSQSTLHLGTSRQMDRVSQFANTDWLNSARPAQLLESTIPPGQIGTFEFTMKAPATTGTYNEYFNVLVEGREWLNDPGMFFTVNVNTAASPNNSNDSVLNSGESLNKDDLLLSPDSQSALTLQRDGNVALHANFKTVWNTGVFPTANRLVMQGDGNLVLYTAGGQALWNTATAGNPGARLVVQTDGNLVMYSAGNAVLWATYTLHTPEHLSYINTTLPSGRLYPGQSIDTTDRRFKLILQTDGNLVLYSPNRATWATGTDGRSVSFLAMQPDGNLVLYDRSAKPIWYTGTSGHGSLRLLLQPDGNAVLYNWLNVPFWHTQTSGVL